MSGATRIETERLILRPWTLEDAGDMFAYAGDPDVGPNAGWKPHESLEESRQIVSRWLEFTEERRVFAIEEKASGRVIGSVGIEEDDRRAGVPGVKSLGYVLGKPYWGRGYMTEAASAAIDYAFQALKLKLLSVDHYPENRRSRRVIEKCGFRFEGRVRRASVIYDGAVKDHCSYSMTAAEYWLLQAKKRGLSLALPEELPLEKIGELQREMEGESWGESAPGAARLRGKTPEEWLEYTVARRIYVSNPAFVPETLFFVVEGEKRILGAISLRHELNDVLLHHGGHIGYGLRPSCRGRRLAPCMLALCLEKARERGIDRAMVTCAEWNAPSAATIEACGGEMESRAEYDGEIYRRYFIQLYGGREQNDKL